MLQPYTVTKMRLVGSLLIAVSLLIIAYIFTPVAKQEVKYNLERVGKVKYIVDQEPLNTFEKRLDPPNTDFSIVIPKIGATAPIIDNVNPNDETAYLKALRRGVAHATGTAQPGAKGNVYLFAHSTDAFYNVNTYNAVFYLIGKLEKGDEIYVYYQGEKIKYIVDYKKVVSADDVKYLGDLEQDKKTLTLQTCYPPGTTFKRLVIVADLDGQ